MRIAQVAPLSEAVPPRRYGGTERVVSYLTEELVRQGHEVTLFASGDSVTSARLVSPLARAMRHDETPAALLFAQALMLEQVAQRAETFDIIHFHIEPMHLPLARRLPAASVTTLHGRLDLPGMVSLYEALPDVNLVSISDAQRLPLLRTVPWAATVYHGLPQAKYRAGGGKGGYLAFLGRISPEKRLDRAIEIARITGIPLRVAAKVDPVDEGYFRKHIAPLLDDPLIDFIGEIGDGEKQEFLGDARALLFPIDWPEPFGMVMIEALACATPVVAFDCGSVPEVVEHGSTGFVVRTVTEAAGAVRDLNSIDRGTCRLAFEERFTAERMADEYVRVYDSIIRRHMTRVA